MRCARSFGTATNEDGSRSAFCNVFVESFRDLGILLYRSLQMRNSRTVTSGAMVKNMDQTVLKEMDVQDEMAKLLALQCADLQNDPVTVGQVVEGSSFWHRLRLQGCASQRSKQLSIVACFTEPRDREERTGMLLNGGTGQLQILGLDQHGFWLM